MSTRTGNRSAILNDQTRLKLLVRPGFKSRGQVLPYLYRVGLQTQHGDLGQTEVYLTDWTENLDEANHEFSQIMTKLDAYEEE